MKRKTRNLLILLTVIAAAVALAVQAGALHLPSAGKKPSSAKHSTGDQGSYEYYKSPPPEENTATSVWAFKQ